MSRVSPLSRRFGLCLLGPCLAMGMVLPAHAYPRANPEGAMSAPYPKPSSEASDISSEAPFLQTASPGMMLAQIPGTPDGHTSLDGPGVTTDAPVAATAAVQIVAKTSTQIGAPMSGRLIDFPFADGDRFAAGAILARFQCAQQEAMVAHAHAEVDKRQGLLSVQQRLRELKSWSESDFKTAGSDVSAARADLMVASANVADCIVHAPFAGRVSNVGVHNYQFLQIGTPMLDILDDSQLELSMVVPSLDLRALQPGAVFQIHIRETGHDYTAKVIRVSGRVDPVSQTVKIYGKIQDATPDLLPGMTGIAKLPAL